MEYLNSQSFIDNNELKKFALLPFVLFCKACKTIFRLIGVGIGVLMLVLTLGASTSMREFFVNRVTIFAKDLADWILFPFAIFVSLFRISKNSF